MESTLLGLRLGCRSDGRCCEYRCRQSNNVVVKASVVVRLHRGTCEVAKAHTVGEWQAPDVPDNMWNSFFGIQLSNAINYHMVAKVVVERYQPLLIRTSPLCCLLTRFTRVPHCDRINEERPVEGIEPAFNMATPQ